MSFISRFYNSKNGDRTYNAADWAEYFASFISNGVFANPANGCQVAAAGNLSVKVRPGKLWINGYYSVNTSDYSFTLSAANASNARYDRVVARLDLTQRTTTLAIVKGTAAAIPTVPTLTRTDTIYELGLAVITVRAGVTSISQSDITDTRMNDDACGVVKGIIDQISTEDLFAQYDSAFHKWFHELETELDENTAAHLYSMIQSIYNNVQALNNQLVDDVTQKQYHFGISNGELYIEEGEISPDGGFSTLSSDKNYIHNQTAANSAWTVQHNLGKYCSVTVVDSAGNVIVGNVEYLDTNNLIIKFSAPVTGKAYCN